jgi:hypothetical protein
MMMQKKQENEKDQSVLHGSGAKNEKGMVLVVATIMLTIVIAFGVIVAIMSTAETRISGHAYQDSQVFYVAEGAVDYGVNALTNILAYDQDPTQQLLDNIPLPGIPTGYALDDFSVDKLGAPIQKEITWGAFKGMDVEAQRYNITADVSRSNEQTTIARTVELTSMSGFEFYIFWYEDLELYPKFPMTFDGHVHSNGDIYMGTTLGMTFNGPITAAGHIYHHTKGGGVIAPPAAIDIMDAWGDLQAMLQGGIWLDADEPNWETEAITRWGGTVMDASHGIYPLYYVLPSSVPSQIEIIQRGLITDPPELRAAKYWYDAPIRILEGFAYDSSGIPINMGPGTITSANFFDRREGRTMYVTQLDIGAMIANGTAPDNGVIYISGSWAGDAVRLINAETLPDGGLTVVTDNPLYIYGSYNITPKRPASILADAVTILSEDFEDYKTFIGKINQQACETWVNTGIMAGSQEAVALGAGGEFNGGLETILRFLERWSSVHLHFRGSLLAPWLSQQATGVWEPGTYYSPPIHDYGYDPSLTDPTTMPPGPAWFQTIVLGSWQQIS